MAEFTSVRITIEDHIALKKIHEDSRIPMIHLLSEAILDLIKKYSKSEKVK